MQDLSDIDAKLNHVSAQFDAFAADLQKWLGPQNFVIIDGAIGPDVYRLDAYLTADPPPEIGFRGGQLVHEIRASLDWLACALARRNVGHDRDTYFPIALNEETFNKSEIKKLKNLSDRDRGMIAALRPYGGGNDLLRALHEVDIINKHRRPLLSAALALPVVPDGVPFDAHVHDPIVTRVKKHVATVKCRQVFQMRRRLAYIEPNTKADMQGIAWLIEHALAKTRAIVDEFR